MRDLNQILKIGDKENEIKGNSFQIVNNTLQFENRTLQLSNVSMIEKRQQVFQVPWRSIIVFVVSLFVISMSFGKTLLFLILLVTMSFSVYYIWSSFKQRESVRNLLVFSLNSGDNYLLYFKDPQFLDEVKKVVEESFNNKTMNVMYDLKNTRIIHTKNIVSATGQISVNIDTQDDVMMKQADTSTCLNDTNHFVNSYNTIIGDFHAEGMSVTQEVVTHFLIDQKTTWEDVSNELRLITQHLPKNSREKVLSDKLLQAIQEKNERIVCTLVENNAATFLTDVFKNATGTIKGSLVIQLITHIISMK